MSTDDTKDHELKQALFRLDLDPTIRTKQDVMSVPLALGARHPRSQGLVHMELSPDITVIEDQLNSDLKPPRYLLIGAIEPCSLLKFGPVLRVTVAESHSEALVAPGSHYTPRDIRAAENMLLSSFFMTCFISSNKFDVAFLACSRIFRHLNNLKTSVIWQTYIRCELFAYRKRRDCTLSVHGLKSPSIIAFGLANDETFIMA
ncbi:hypothetical protein F4679DRAFT_586069 [Xylaria curta]|nr:hypothetical protein F4679DRAFT_586069 [Xylaria curta]